MLNKGLHVSQVSWLQKIAKVANMVSPLTQSSGSKVTPCEYKSCIYSGNAESGL